jgi:hypothetical protein
MLLKIFFALTGVFSGALAHAAACELSSAALMKYEERVLSAAERFHKNPGGRDLLQITEPLACLLEIQERSEGQLKLFANSFLRPIFGGPQIDGVPFDHRYKIIADELTKISAHAQLDHSVMAAHARGSWDFYKLFCQQGDLEFCPVMLPSETQVLEGTPLLASSNMLLLRRAYYSLKGKQRDEIAARIKSIYRTLPMDKGLKRKVIDEIYSELFAPAMPLSYLS